VTRPKGVRVTVLRFGRGASKYADMLGAHVTWRDMQAAGVPALKPGESVTGRMVFVREKKKGAK
jgi:hypothetical protein